MCGILVSSGTYSIQEIYLNAPVEHYTHVYGIKGDNEDPLLHSTYEPACQVCRNPRILQLCAQWHGILCLLAAVIVGMLQYLWHSQPGVFRGILF